MDRHKSQAALDADIGQVPLSSLVQPAPDRKAFKLEPTDEMRKAKSWIETVVTPPRADKTLLAMHGWLSPSGDLYACGWEDHDALTSALGFAHQSEIEAAGFCKLSRLEWLVAQRYRERELTAEQWTTIERWYERNNFPEEHYLRLATKL